MNQPPRGEVDVVRETTFNLVLLCPLNYRFSIRRRIRITFSQYEKLKRNCDYIEHS